jgi:hypothetical protein
MRYGIAKRRLAAAVVATSLGLVGAPAAAETLSVASSAVDGGDGTADAPFNSIAACLQAAAPGDTCQLASGRYREVVRLRDLQGKPGKPVTLAAAPGAKVVLDGTVPFTGPWELDETLADGSRVWKTISPLPVWQVFHNDRAMEIARFPNAQFGEPEYWLQQESWRHMTPESVPGLAIDERPEGEEGVAPPIGNLQALADIDADLTGAVAIMNIASWITIAQPVETHEAGSNRFTYSTDFAKSSGDLGADVERMGEKEPEKRAGVLPAGCTSGPAGRIRRMALRPA